MSAADEEEGRGGMQQGSLLHALAESGVILARNGRPITCWECGGNHRKADCPQASGERPQTYGRPRPTYAPPLVNRPGLNSPGPHHVTSITGVAAEDKEAVINPGLAAITQPGIATLTARLDAQSAQIDRLVAALSAPLASMSVPELPGVIVAADAPSPAYMQVGRSTMADGAEMGVWATEQALGSSSN